MLTDVFICSSLYINEQHPLLPSPPSLLPPLPPPPASQWSDELVIFAYAVAALDNVITGFTLYRCVHWCSLPRPLLMKIILLMTQCSSCGLCMWGLVWMSPHAGNHGNMCASAVWLKFGLWGKSSVGVKPLKDPQRYPSTNTNASAASVAAHLGFEVNERWLWDWFKLSHAQNTYRLITNETQHNPTVICLT